MATSFQAALAAAVAAVVEYFTPAAARRADQPAGSSATASAAVLEGRAVRGCVVLNAAPFATETTHEETYHPVNEMASAAPWNVDAELDEKADDATSCPTTTESDVSSIQAGETEPNSPSDAVADAGGRGVTRNSWRLSDHGQAEPPCVPSFNSDQSSAESMNCPGSGSGQGRGEEGGALAKRPLPLSRARCVALVATVTGANFLNTLSIQAVVIILPSIGAYLSIPESRQQWIVSAYALTFGCFLLLWGRIGDLKGKRAIFVSGSAWVALTTLANPFVRDEIGFNVLRGLQGLGAAANVPTALGILGTTFQPGKAKNYAFTAYAAGAPLGSVFGNLLAGFITQYTSWKWVFGVMAALAALVALAGVLVIPPDLDQAAVERDETDHTPHVSTSSPLAVDWIGGVLVTVGLLLLMFALTEGNVVGWSTPCISVLLVLSLVLIVSFVLWQCHLEKRSNRRECADGPENMSGVVGRILGNCTAGIATRSYSNHIVPPHRSTASSLLHRLLTPPPLMKISMFRSAHFSAAMLNMALFFASFNGFLVYATFFYQSYQSLGPLDTTLRFLPTGVAGFVPLLFVSRLLATVPTALILVAGNACVSVSSLLFALPLDPQNTSYFATGLPAMALAVMGADTTWAALTLFASSALPRQDQALGGALVNAVGQFGRAIGLAIGTAVQVAVTERERRARPDADAGLPAGNDDDGSTGRLLPWDGPSLAGLRAADWVNFAFGVGAVLVVATAFRGAGIVGKAGTGKVDGAEMDDDVGRERGGVRALQGGREGGQQGIEERV